jgi:DNA-binding MarR family transcriptional regulator
MNEPPVERSVGYLVKRAQQSLRRRCDTALRPIGLTMSQYAVLRALHDHPDATASDLARLCFVTRQSLRDVLGGLRSTGLVADMEAPPDGRKRALRLTSQGLQRLQIGHATVIDVESAMLQGISVKARTELAALLSRCTDNLDNLPETEH